MEFQKSPAELLDEFYLTEINGGESVMRFWLDWIKNGEQQSMSGDVFYLEKKGDEVILGNLWDEDFQEVSFSKVFIIDFLSLK